MTRTCDLPGELLIAWLDGELRGAQREYVALHLEHCPVCRQFVASSRMLDGRLRQALPPIDDPAARRRLQAAVTRAAAQPRRGLLPWRGWMPATLPVRLPAIRLVVAGLAVFAIVVSPETARAASSAAVDAAATVGEAVAGPVGEVVIEVQETITGD